ncbi:MAG: hypothetical protein AAGH42_09470 [Pseudomonadota bacterium]
MFDSFSPPTPDTRPTITEIEAIWKEKVTCSRDGADAVTAIETIINEKLAPGGIAISLTCALPEDTALDWFLASGTLTEIDFFYELFRTKGFKKALAKTERTLIPPKVKRDFKPRRSGFIAESGVRRASGDLVKEDRFNFSVQSCFTQTGMLGADIDRAFARPVINPNDVGDAGEAMSMAVAAADIMIAGNYRDGLCHLSPSGWAPWFQSVSWDRTYSYIQHGTRTITLIFMTDSEPN